MLVTHRVLTRVSPLTESLTRVSPFTESRTRVRIVVPVVDISESLYQIRLVICLTECFHSREPPHRVRDPREPPRVRIVVSVVAISESSHQIRLVGGCLVTSLVTHSGGPEPEGHLVVLDQSSSKYHLGTNFSEIQALFS